MLTNSTHTHTIVFAFVLKLKVTSMLTYLFEILIIRLETCGESFKPCMVCAVVTVAVQVFGVSPMLLRSTRSTGTALCKIELKE